jgi:hypothetical protein
VAAREDDAVRRQEGGPFGMQVFVGDDVTRETLDLEPIGQVQVGVELVGAA